MLKFGFQIWNHHEKDIKNIHSDVVFVSKCQYRKPAGWSVE